MANQNDNSLLGKYLEPFLGFKLSFIEMEILRSIHYYKLTEITEIYEFMTAKYPENKLSKSQFYRTIDKLEKGKYIKAIKEGNSKRLFCLENGIKEIYFLLKYLFGVLRDQIFTDDALQEIVSIATPAIGCLRNFSLLNIGPFPLNLPHVMELCLKCDKPVNIDDDSLIKPIFISLSKSDNSLLQKNINKITIIDSDNPYDLLPKDNSIDIIFETFVLYHYNIDNILNELHRILKPDGLIFFFEPTSNLSNIIIHIMNQIMVGKSNELESWTIRPNEKKLLDIDDTIKVISKKFEFYKVTTELALTLFIARKK